MKFIERKIYHNLQDAARYQKKKKVTNEMVQKILESLKK